MGQHDKLLARLKACNGPFPYRDLCRLLAGCGYEETSKNGGSSLRFFNEKFDDIIRFHAPHPSSDVPFYVVKLVRIKLEEKGLI